MRFLGTRDSQFTADFCGFLGVFPFWTGARAGIEKRMTAMATGLERDHALGAALSKRGNELLGKQWSPEWSAGSPDGGMARELSNQRRTVAVVRQLTESLGRGRNLGIGL